MAVVMSMHWPEASLEQYELTRRTVAWETNVPGGAMFHLAWMADDGFRVLDLWESAEAFHTFSQTRLLPAVQRIGIEGEPRITLAEAHAIFNAAVPPHERPRARRARPAARRLRATATSKTARSPRKTSARKPARGRRTAPKRKAKR